MGMKAPVPNPILSDKTKKRPNPPPAPPVCREYAILEAQKLKPFIIIGPGPSIKKFMEGRNWTHEDFSQISGFSINQIQQLLNNEILISRETAALLSKAFENSEGFWMKLDRRYRERLRY